MATLEKAIEIAAKAHSGQLDKGGEPYILHCLRVMLRHEEEPYRIVGVLHDVVEDTPATLDDLMKAGFDVNVILAINALTKRPGESKIQAASRACTNRIACYVKLSDNLDNLDPKRIKNLTKEQVFVYLEVQHMLANAIDSFWAHADQDLQFCLEIPD